MTARLIIDMTSSLSRKKQSLRAGAGQSGSSRSLYGIEGAGDRPIVSPASVEVSIAMIPLTK